MHADAGSLGCRSGLDLDCIADICGLGWSFRLVAEKAAFEVGGWLKCVSHVLQTRAAGLAVMLVFLGAEMFLTLLKSDWFSDFPIFWKGVKRGCEDVR